MHRCSLTPCPAAGHVDHTQVRRCVDNTTLARARGWQHLPELVPVKNTDADAVEPPKMSSTTSGVRAGRIRATEKICRNMATRTMLTVVRTTLASRAFGCCLACHTMTQQPNHDAMSTRANAAAAPRATLRCSRVDVQDSSAAADVLPPPALPSPSTAMHAGISTRDVVGKCAAASLDSTPSYTMVELEDRYSGPTAVRTLR